MNALPGRAPALLVRGGCVYTADADSRMLPTGSVLVVGDTIAAVGSVGEVDAAVAALPAEVRAGLRTIDGSRHLVLPGFVNPHWHEMFAMRLPFKGALRDPRDAADEPGVMALGGDARTISTMFDTFQDVADGLTPDEAEAIARYSLWTQLRSGTTALGDVGSFNRPEAMAAAARALGIRCSVSYWTGDAVCAPGESRHRRTRDTDGVLARLENLLADCARDTSGLVRAQVSASYITNVSDELGEGLGKLARAYDVPFATHVGALRDEVDVVRTYYGTTPVRRLAGLGLLDERLMAVHCAFLDEHERSLLLAAKAHISHSPAKYGPTGESTVTETRAIPELRLAGLDVSLSTDGGSLPIGGMPEAMRAAWHGYTELFADNTALLPTDALAMATRIAARGLRRADIGALVPGLQADLVLVPADDWRYLLNPRPLEGFLNLGGSADVKTVIVAGRVLIEDGRTVHLDEEQLTADYLDALESFSTRRLGIPSDVVAGVLAAHGRGAGA
ncbi:amidohydrolase family protein [Streptomyces sp. H34-S4]|uniref:amidohydrolase family protein n=1 Tax=Streptomyces sp. H34-S4 TaxID=2996463 RepID=UPI0022714FAE|nr:amidohydrolase family protein [Streptomyces sp. H34-S4]MCY0935126.1 amidohydrolase family protein [Streptomyces sp. H34-S4]